MAEPALFMTDQAQATECKLHPVPTNGPVPTDLHWALVLLIGVFTCGLFTDGLAVC